jgi:hypothetical protein
MALHPGGTLRPFILLFAAVALLCSALPVLIVAPLFSQLSSLPEPIKLLVQVLIVIGVGLSCAALLVGLLILNGRGEKR